MKLKLFNCGMNPKSVILEMEICNLESGKSVVWEMQTPYVQKTYGHQLEG